MLVTVYMPTHNRSEMLVNAIESVLNQSYVPIELIVVNDGSSDDTAQVLTHYQNKHAVKVISLDKAQGACHARNLAINAATGHLITGLDDDDLFTRDHIANLVTHFDEKYAFIAASVREDKGHKTIERTLDAGEITLDDMLYYNKAGNQVLTLTSRIQAVNGFDETMPAFQDYELWLRLCQKFGTAYKLTQASYVLNTAHEKNRISSSNSKRMKALDLFIKKHQHLMNKQQRKAIEFLRFHISGKRLSMTDFINIICIKNYKRVISLYLKQHFPFIKSAIDRFRYKKA